MLIFAVVATLSACGKSEKTTAASPSAQPDVVASPAPQPNPSPIANTTANTSPVDVWADLSPDTFRAQYDELTKADGGDTIKRMSKTKDGIAVTLNDTRFQHGIAELKKLNLANGKFQSKLSLVLSTNSSGNVTKIAIMGDRSDPINLMRFIGAVGVVNTMLNRDQDEKANTDFLATLSLMRGDDDPTIGKLVSSFNRGGAFQCLSMPSDQTTVVGCAVEARS
ncbi:hypothetical protein PI87_16835 [Ralstonia sp. A12]|uniref:hypothetical protein n=1 Tax=Ralstonia sp. A12 TaxID=1217052 RepID=UPI00057481C0|nr:hypothetical protein [Ralstonia sp. A12]KHK54172.1 hypothetical protein PI87_16835 [Ralstonia sp. A12]